MALTTGERQQLAEIEAGLRGDFPGLARKLGRRWWRRGPSRALERCLPTAALMAGCFLPW